MHTAVVLSCDGPVQTSVLNERQCNKSLLYWAYQINACCFFKIDAMNKTRRLLNAIESKSTLLHYSVHHNDYTRRMNKQTKIA